MKIFQHNHRLILCRHTAFCDHELQTACVPCSNLVLLHTLTAKLDVKIHGEKANTESETSQEQTVAFAGEAPPAEGVLLYQLLYTHKLTSEIPTSSMWFLSLYSLFPCPTHTSYCNSGEAWWNSSQVVTYLQCRYHYEWVAYSLNDIQGVLLLSHFLGCERCPISSCNLGFNYQMDGQ